MIGANAQRSSVSHERTEEETQPNNEWPEVLMTNETLSYSAFRESSRDNSSSAGKESACNAGGLWT